MLGDTIAALATAPGDGALALIRVSGPCALQVADRCFRGRRPSEMPSHTVAYGSIVDAEGAVLDRVLLTVLRGPRTSTGEDTVEVSCHGGRCVSSRVLVAVLASGARPAEPGEFTRRAVLHGRMDLVQAEAVLEVIRARTPEGLRSALAQLGGEVSRRFEEVRGKLDTLRMQMECAIDFAEEMTPWPDERIAALLRDAADDVRQLLERARGGRRLQDGAIVAIVGKPNVGKSTLFNRLVGEERAIVSAQPGTTRDTVSEWIDLGGIPVRLVDTAGIRESECDIERAAVERALQQGSAAERVLLLLDGSGGPTEEDRCLLDGSDPTKTLVVLNKCDLEDSRRGGGPTTGVGNGPSGIRVSALTGKGVESLRAELIRSLLAGGDAGDGICASIRQIDILNKVYHCLEHSVMLMDNPSGIGLAAADLREATEVFGNITGAITSDEILDRIFSEFCIGK